MAEQTDQARVIARSLAESGKLASRRGLRSSGVKGSNEALNALARELNAELAGGSAIVNRATPCPAEPG